MKINIDGVSLDTAKLNTRGLRATVTEVAYCGSQDYYQIHLQCRQHGAAVNVTIGGETGPASKGSERVIVQARAAAGTHENSIVAYCRDSEVEDCVRRNVRVLCDKPLPRFKKGETVYFKTEGGEVMSFSKGTVESSTRDGDSFVYVLRMSDGSKSSYLDEADITRDRQEMVEAVSEFLKKI